MSAVTFEIDIPRLFDAEVERVGARLVNNAREGMDRGMKKVASLTRANRRAPWNKPGAFGFRGFQWEATGLAEETLQGYVVGYTYPVDYPTGSKGPRTDRFGRLHDASARKVAPVDHRLGSDTKIVGVLTMTATYAPAESQSSATEEDYSGNRPGLQAVIPGVPITVVGVGDHQSVLARETEDYLIQTMRVA